VKEDLSSYQLFKENLITEFKDRDNLPIAALLDTLGSVVYGNNPLCKQPSVKDVEELDYSRSVEIFKERFSNAADFKFTIVGSIDEDTLEPLLEKYVASLPVSKSREKVKRGEPLYLPGEKMVRYNKQMHVPATRVFLHNFVKTNSSTDKIIYPMLQDVLDLVYTKKVRQEQGGTYGVQVLMKMKQYPCDNAVLLIEFTTDASKVDVLVPIVHEELQRIAEEGPNEVDMQKVKEHLKNAFADKQRDNYYWNSRLQYIQFNGKDLDANYLKNIDKISAKDIQKAAQRFLKSKNQKEVVQVGIANE
jgi:zinc protease